MADIRCGDSVISADHFIDGRRVASDERFVVRSPIDGSVLGEISAGGPREVECAVDAASRAFPAWAALGPARRAVLLRRLADLIDRSVEPLAVVETVNNGSLLEA